MSALSEEERRIIAQRAAGSYAILPRLRRLMQDHKKNRSPEDAVFLEFGALVLKKSWDWAEYERLQRLVLTEVPEPWGPQVRRKERPAGDVDEVPKPKKKRTVTCGICGGQGHNARSCSDKPDTPTITHTDGFERVKPGYDPNPPKKEEP